MASTLPHTIRSWTGDIRFWVALAFALRLIGIANPPLETSHHWRQTSVLMVARNYAEHGVDLLHPRMDNAGALSGITGMEFPLLNMLIAWGMLLFGDAYWPGRIIVLIAGSLGVLRFHALVGRHVGARAALYGALLLLFSLWFMYSRKVMPDVFALSLVLAGLERLDAARGTRNPWSALALGSLLIGAGLLSKITAGCLLAAWPVLAWPHRNSRIVQLATALIATVMVPALWWYFQWVPYLVETYGFWHFFMGGPMVEGAIQLLRNWPRTLDNFYFDALRFSGSAVFLLGLYFAIKRRQRGMLTALALLSGAFLLVMLKAGDTFWVHAYYVLPFVPTMALVGGYGLAQLPNARWAQVPLVIVAVEGLAAQVNDFRLSPPLVPLLRLEEDLGQDNGLIAMNTGQVPTAMFFAHRRGWTMTNDALAEPANLGRLQQEGCTRIVVFKHTFDTSVELPWPVLLENELYRIHGAPSVEIAPH